VSWTTPNDQHTTSHVHVASPSHSPIVGTDKSTFAATFSGGSEYIQHHLIASLPSEYIQHHLIASLHDHLLPLAISSHAHFLSPPGTTAEGDQTPSSLPHPLVPSVKHPDTVSALSLLPVAIACFIEVPSPYYLYLQRFCSLFVLVFLLFCAAPLHLSPMPSTLAKGASPSDLSARVAFLQELAILITLPPSVPTAASKSVDNGMALSVGSAAATPFGSAHMASPHKTGDREGIRTRIPSLKHNS
jgi:hypothetical protein